MNPRDRNGRVCGCDRGAAHECEEHREASDGSTRWIKSDFGVRGPFAGFCIALKVIGEQGGHAWLVFDRWEAEDLVEELQRRLALRA